MTTKIHYYRFDIKNPTEKEEYNALRQFLIAQNLECFDAINHSVTNIKPLNGQDIELDTEYLFNNQWNTKPIGDSKTGLRVFDWTEVIYPNRNMKEGSYLEQTEEMRKIREETFKCGYCGAQYHLPTQIFCEMCLGGEHLKRVQLHMLTLNPISGPREDQQPTEELIQMYEQVQLVARKQRAENRIKSKLEDLNKSIENAKLELDAFTRIIDAGLDFDNWIYYAHTKEFCFGWRDPSTPEERAEITAKLINFPYKYTFK